jgi:amino acid transporter
MDFKIYNYQVLASFIIFFLTLINHYGINSSFFLQKVATLVPIAFLLLLSGLSVIFIQIDLFKDVGEKILFSNLSIPYSNPSLLGLGAALVPVYWTFSGWNSPLALGEEIRDPHRIIPLTMVFGPIIVTAIYGIFSFVFISIVPYSVLQAGNVDPYLIMGKFLLNNFGIHNETLLNSLPKMISLIIFLIVFLLIYILIIFIKKLSWVCGIAGAILRASNCSLDKYNSFISLVEYPWGLVLSVTEENK